MKKISLLLLLGALWPALAFAQSGHVDARTMHDPVFGRERKIWIYTPANYDAKRAQPYDLVVAFDGADYLDTIPLPAMLDSLAPGRFIAVLIDDLDRGERIAELGNNPRFAEFMAQQLMPWVRTNYHITHDPQRTIVTGSSAGGLAALYVALLHPELFGKVISQSAALWRGFNASNSAPYEWLTTQYASLPHKDIELWLDVGELETHGALGGVAPSILDANRRLLAVLKQRGYVVKYFEVPNGVHAPFAWRSRLPLLLREAVGGKR